MSQSKTLRTFFSYFSTIYKPKKKEFQTLLFFISYFLRNRLYKLYFLLVIIYLAERNVCTHTPCFVCPVECENSCVSSIVPVTTTDKPWIRRLHHDSVITVIRLFFFRIT